MQGRMIAAHDYDVNESGELARAVYFQTAEATKAEMCRQEPVQGRMTKRIHKSSDGQEASFNEGAFTSAEGHNPNPKKKNPGAEKKWTTLCCRSEGQKGKTIRKNRLL